jgi:hypothetical protein
MIGYKNQSIEISCKLDDGVVTQYPYAVILDINGTTISSITLNHKFSGQYSSSWIPTDIGYYTVNYSVYSDSLYTTLNKNYNQGMETLFITEQPAASSQIEAYGGGGGGKDHHYAVYGGKSVWTRDQRDKVIKFVSDTYERLKKFEKEEKEHYKESQDSLTKILNRVDNLITTLGSLKTTSKEMDKDIDNIIKALKKQKEIVSTSSQIHAAIDEINNLAKIVVSMMPDEKLENVYKELEENGEGNITFGTEQAISGQK